jgi:AraC-like DNA-binding protein
VERDFKIDRSVLYYADKLCITPKHLSAVVKAVSGHTAGDWIDKYVVLAAKVMLRSSSYTIQEISSDLNFSNQSFFGKYFKQHVGMSPSDFRLQDV